MELLQLTYFCDAAENENFSKTAAKFGVPTSNISQTVKRLETELGTELFVRTPNRIRLNDKGRAFYVGAKKALDCLSEAKLCIEDDNVGGEIRLLVLTNRRIVTLAIEKFQNAYPEVAFVISHKVGKNDEDYHFCISDVYPFAKKVLGERIFAEKMLLAAKAGTQITESQITPELLASQRYITMGRGTRLYDRANAICRDFGFTPEIVVETDDPFYVRRYVEMGMGVAIVPSISWRGLFTDDIKLIDINAGCRYTYVFYDKSKKSTRAANMFLKILKETFAAEM